MILEDMLMLFDARTIVTLHFEIRDVNRHDESLMVHKKDRI